MICSTNRPHLLSKDKVLGVEDADQGGVNGCLLCQCGDTGNSFTAINLTLKHTHTHTHTIFTNIAYEIILQD